MHRHPIRIVILAATVICTAAIGYDLTRLPTGDGKVSQAPEPGSVWTCRSTFRQGARIHGGPWLRPDGTFDMTAKVAVARGQTWPGHMEVVRDGEIRRISGNNLPNHAAGRFPIARTDAAFAFDTNPNPIRPQEVQLDLPALPRTAAVSACLPMGPIGILLTGAYLFNAVDDAGLDAVAHETQDECFGHPAGGGVYHYHSMTNCLADPGEGHSALIGYAFDGFGIFGRRGEDGKVLTNADLDACHGHSHEIEWDGERRDLYHYHATWEYPYTLGCYRGTPAVRVRNRPVSARGQNGPAPGPGGSDRPIDAAAQELGIDVEALRRALGPPPPDFSRAARELDLSEDAIRDAMQRARRARQ